MPLRISVLVAAALTAVALPSVAQGADRYALQNQCLDLAGSGPVRAHATALGRFLFLRTDGSVVAVQPDGSLGSAKDPSPAADFAVTEAPGDQFTLAPQSTHQPVKTLALPPATGCATFPEASLNTTGSSPKPATEYGSVQGILEGHMHWMAYDYFGGHFRCGRPWHEYGIAYALPDCADNEGPQGTTATLQNVLNYGNPAQAHSTAGYPTLPNQSKDNLNYEGMYYRWVERVYKMGLRMMVMGVNENRVLCELQTNRTESCNEMDTMRRGFKAIRTLEDYVDAQAGGPGKGFFQVVTDPFQARRVINSGRMAVVLEIETSEPFDCRNVVQPSCTEASVDREMDEMNKLGVRSSLLLNKFDNPLTGVRFDSGTTSYLIDAGNRQSAGVFWSAQTCTGKLHDNEIDIGDPRTGALANQVLGILGLPSGTFPTYPPAPHCNTRGLTDLGRHVVRKMMDMHWIVNPDHESQAGVDETLSLLEARHYSGVISPHGWMDPGNWPRLWKLGGLAFPGHSATDQYVKDWKAYRPRQTPFKFGWGYGADLGGLSHQPDKAKDGSITYPFKSYDGKVTFDRQTTGTRTFDFAKEGVAHYGLYADWLADLKRVGGQPLADDMMQGAEAYLQMWERASGVPAKRCFFRKEGMTPKGRGPIHLGDRWTAVLASAGQPQQRDRAWSWCVKGKENRSKADVAVFSKSGKVDLVGSTASLRFARGVRVGAPARSLRGARAIGGGVSVRRVGRTAYVFAVSGGRVRAVGVTTARFAAGAGALRTAMRRVLRAKADNIPKTFIPAAEQASGSLAGRSLAGSADAATNAKMAMFCSLGL